ncbi:MAG TPA: hypothetical protein VMP01_00925 [Pirellulaceae bacterium]|nr:hypothetical protein [Pirellulaceae bacterium]
MRPTTAALLSIGLPFLAATSLPAQLVQVRQDFSKDPGWDHKQAGRRF